MTNTAGENSLFLMLSRMTQDNLDEGLDPEWRNDAVCRGREDLDFFYNSDRKRTTQTKKRKATQAEQERLTTLAQDYCAVCPVRQECLTTGKRGNSQGLFGGVILVPGQEDTPLID